MTGKSCKHLDHIEEYKSTIRHNNNTDRVNWGDVTATLVAEHEWTEEGASHLIHLARDYGSFILSHAFALATVLKQEDGEIGL